MTVERQGASAAGRAAVETRSAGARVGLYPGTFDPLHLGHMDIVRRGVRLVDKLIIGVAANEAKRPLFSVDERVEMVRAAVRTQIEGGEDIEVRAFDDLLMHFAERLGADVIIRGLRAVSDFEYEFQMVGMNRALNDQIELVFLMADPHHQAIASKLVKEIARLDGDISKFVSKDVALRLSERLGD